MLEKSKLIRVVLVLVLGLALGYWIGTQSKVSDAELHRSGVGKKLVGIKIGTQGAIPPERTTRDEHSSQWEKHELLQSECYEWQKFINSSDASDYPAIYAKISELSEVEQKCPLRLLMLRWLGLNPIAAVEFAHGVSPRSHSKMILGSLISNWPKDKLREGFDWIKAHPELPELLTSILYRTSRCDPALAAQHLIELSDSRTKTDLVQNVVACWSEVDPGNALSWTEEHLEGTDQQVAKKIIGCTMAKSQPESAVKILDTMAFGHQRNELMRQILGRWFSLNSSSAVNWFESLDKTDKRVSLPALASAWARENAEESMNYAIANLQEMQQDDFVYHTLASWAESSPKSALDWLSKNPKFATEGKFEMVIGSWSEFAPAEAMLAVDQVSDEKVRAQLTGTVALKWVQKDREAAAAAIAALDEGPAKAMGVTAVVHNWVRQDSISASKWLAAIPTGESKDSGIKQLTELIRYQEPESAFRWALEISEPQLRTRTISEIGKRWISEEGDRAVTSINNMGLPYSERKKLGLD